jgi:uncharacterized protein YfaP (DUF2135 family)
LKTPSLFTLFQKEGTAIMTNWLYRFLREPRGKRAARRRAANSQAGLGRVRPLRIESLEMRRMLSAQPLLVTSPSATAVTLGTTNTTLTDSAVLSGGSSPTGSIVFALMAPDGSTTVDTETVTVNGNGAYTTPTGYTLPTTGTVIGTYQWNVSYGGDINNNSASDNNDPAEQVTVSPAQPTLVTTPNPTSAMLPTALTDSAVLSGGSSPTGSITFTLEAPGGAVVETETVSLNGNGTYSTPGAAGAGVNLVQNGGFETATFSGWTTTAASLGSDFDVGTAGPPHSGYYDVALGALSYIPDSISQTLATVPGDTYTLSYWVSHDSTNAENDFQVFWGGNSVQNLSNVSAFGWTNYTFTETAASATTVLKFSAYEVPAWFFLDDVSVSVHGYTPTQVGTYQWNASYSGDANNNPASDNNDPAEQVTVSPAQPTLVGTPHPTAVTPGPTAITLTDSAVLSGGSSPTGSITFTLVAPGGSTLDIETVTVGGNGTYTTPTGYTLPLRPMPGTYQWDVSYNGDINNNSASDNNDTAEQVTVAAPIAPTFTADSPPVATVGSPYSYQFQASGTQPITYSATGLPAWAQLNSSTGVLSGTPTAPGTSNISVTATNGIVPDATVNVSLVAQYEPPTFTADTPPVAVNGSPYSYQFQASGIGPDPLTYSARNPPGWAQLDPSTGILSGTPTVDGTFDFSVTASNGVAPSTTVNVSLIVAETANNFNVAAGTSSTIPGGTYSGGSTFNVGAGATVTIDSGTFTGGAVFNLGAGAVVNIIDPGYSIDSTDPYRLCCENAIRNQN